MEDLTISQLQQLPFTIVLPDGSTFEDTLEYADAILREHQGTTCIIGAALGVVILLSVLLCMVARSYKSAMFCLYQSNFIWGLISYSLTLRQYMEHHHNITATYFGVMASKSTTHLATAGSFASLFLIISLLSSISFQVHTAYKNLSTPWIKWMVYGLVFVADLQTLLIWTWSVGQVVKDQIKSDELDSSWTYNALWPSFASSTLVCSFILSARLYTIVRSRARLGLEKFDAVKVVLIVALQNATIPALFAFFYSIFGKSSDFPEGVGLLTTLLCCTFFPMGYIWAQAHSQPLNPSDPKYESRKRNSDLEKSLTIKNASYWNGGLPTATTATGEYTEYSLDKEGNRFRTHEIQ